MVSIAIALDECEEVIKPGEVPCRVTSTWVYPNACNTYTITLYEDSLGIQNYTMDDFGIYCNITFNYSDKGSYYYNVSSGDSGSILIKGEDEMASLSVILFLGAITAAIFFVGLTKKRFSENDLLDFILKKSALLLALFLTSLDITILVSIADSAGLGIAQELFRYLWLVNWTIYLSMFTIFLMTILKSFEQWKVQAQRKKYGEE